MDGAGPVLIADRDATTRARAALALRAAGLAVSVVNQASALQAALAQDPPAALVLGALVGEAALPALLEWIQAAAPDTPVILLLRAGQRPPRGGVAETTPYLRKPLEVRQLVGAVHTVLEGREMQRDFRQAVAEIAEQSGERDLLLRTSAAICSTVALPELLAQLAERVVRALHVTVAQVLLLDEQREHLLVETVFPVRPATQLLVPGTRLPVKDFECYQRALAGQVVLLQTGASGFALPPRDREVVLGPFASGLLIPMVATRGVIGVLTLLEDRSWDRSPFTSRKIHLCQALSTQAAIALQNSLLFAERERSHLATLAALVAALDARERETQAHSWRVRAYALRLADLLGMPVAEREPLAAGALLHDIGKIGIPDHILLKPGPLSPHEWVEMRKHPTIGAEILRGLTHLPGAQEIVLTHQERFDGTGYPHGLAKHDIPFGSRIFAVADTLDAITSDRSYHRAAPFAEAHAEIARHGGTQFDPEVVRAFLGVPLDEWRRIRATIGDAPTPLPGHMELTLPGPASPCREGGQPLMAAPGPQTLAL
jgi:putative nucleotidyltransferase with HDIG domain